MSAPMGAPVEVATPSPTANKALLVRREHSVSGCATQEFYKRVKYNAVQTSSAQLYLRSAQSGVAGVFFGFPLRCFASPELVF